MAGLVQQQMAPAGAGKLKITPQSVMQGLHLNQTQQVQLQKIVLAGKKVMFSDQTHGMMQQQMQQPGDWPTKIGMAVAGLMGLLQRESKNSLPPNLLVPAAMVLVAEAADFIQRTQGGLTDKDVGLAIQVAIHAVLRAFGIDGDKMAALSGTAQKEAKDAPEPEEPKSPYQDLVPGDEEQGETQPDDEEAE